MSRIVFGWLTALVSALPLRLGYAIAAALTEVHFRLFPSRRHALLANLAVAMPRSTRRERVAVARQHDAQLQLACCSSSSASLTCVVRSCCARSRSVGREHLEHAVARGRGVIIASSHIGNWELAAVVLAHWGYALHAVAGVQLSRWLTPAVRETKTELAIHTVSPEDGFRKLLRALEHNDLVALMVDGDLYQPRRRGSSSSAARPAGPPARACSPSAPERWSSAATASGSSRAASASSWSPRSIRRASRAPPRSTPPWRTTAERHIREHLDQWCIFRPLWEGAPALEPPSARARRARGRVKIGIVSQSYYPRYGGVTEHVHHTAVELRRRGHEVTIITSRFRRGEPSTQTGVGAHRLQPAGAVQPRVRRSHGGLDAAPGAAPGDPRATISTCSTPTAPWRRRSRSWRSRPRRAPRSGTFHTTGGPEPAAE